MRSAGLALGDGRAGAWGDDGRPWESCLSSLHGPCSAVDEEAETRPLAPTRAPSASVRTRGDCTVRLPGGVKGAALRFANGTCAPATSPPERPCWEGGGDPVGQTAHTRPAAPPPCASCYAPAMPAVLAFPQLATTVDPRLAEPLAV